MFSFAPKLPFFFRSAVSWLGWLALAGAACVVAIVVEPHHGLGHQLQAHCMDKSQAVLDWLGVWHVIEGQIVRIPGHILHLDGGLMDVQWTLAIVVLAGGWGVHCRRGLLHAALLAIAAAGCWLPAVIARIVVAVWLAERWQIETDRGVLNFALGMLLIAGVAATLASTHHFLLLMLGSSKTRRLT